MPETRWLAICLAVGLIAVALVSWLVMRPSATGPSMHFTIELPEGATLGSRGNPLAFSPDGRVFVYCARLNGTTSLFLRMLNQPEARLIAGAEDACNPFFSPDGRWIGYFAARDSRLRKIAPEGGSPVDLCAAPSGMGACWLPDGKILFSPDDLSELWSVPAEGGDPQPVTKLENQDLSHRWPEILPGGKTILFTAGVAGVANSHRIVALSLKTGERSIVAEDASFPRYAPAGHLLYLRSGALFAQPFDAVRLKLKGTPLRVLRDVKIDQAAGACQLAFSPAGSLVYAPAGQESALRSLVWEDRQGSVQRAVVSQGVFSHPRLSPDGTRLAVVGYSPDGASHVWIADLADGSFTRLAQEGNCTLPLWSPDGKWIALASDRNGRWNLFMLPADGSAAAVQLHRSEYPEVPTSWSPDGKHLCLTQFHPDSGPDIWMLAVKEDRVWPFLRQRSGEWGGVFSPDGRWLAYTSDESGLSQVYVRSVSGAGEARQLSTAEGREPVWSPDGRQLYYRYWRGVMSAPFRTDPEPTADAPQLILQGQYGDGAIPGFQNYDISPDGLRFLLIREEGAADRRLYFVHNWFEDLRQISATRR